MKTLRWLFVLSAVAFAQSPPYTILNQPTSRPYPTAYYNQRLPGAGSGGPLTHLMPGSDTIVNTVMHASGSLITGTGLWHSPGADDFGSTTIYYGQASDPIDTPAGCDFGSGNFINGLAFRGPSGAPYSGNPQGTSDSQIDVWDQTTNRAYEFYTFGTNTLPVGGGTVNNGNGYCSEQNPVSGSGIQAGSLSSNGLPPIRNLILMKELAAHHIPHGLYGYTFCDGTADGVYPSRTVFPIGNGSGGVALVCGTGQASAIPDTHRPPNGSLFFLDYTQAQLDCFDPSKSSCTNINKMTVLQFAQVEAATLYGVTLGGTGVGNGLGVPMGESEGAYYYYETHGYPGAKQLAVNFENFMGTATGQGQCTSPTCTVVTRSAPHSLLQWNLALWAGISLVNGKDISGHMHIADPCVAIGLQGISLGGCATVSQVPPNAPTSLTTTPH
jgi:hypothetical protein